MVPIDSAYVDVGTSLGSPEDALSSRRACCWPGTRRRSTLSAGWTRYVLERRFGQPVTTVRDGSLGRVDFADYDVLVLPSGNYAGQISEAVLTRLKDWIRRRRHAGHARRGHALGGGQRASGCSTPTPLLKDGRPDTRTTGPAPASGW